MKLAEILTGPAAWLSPHTRRTPESPKKRLCLFNAVVLLTGESFPKREFQRLTDLIGVPSYNEGWDWNDAPERTWEEVSAIVDAYDRDKMLNP